MTLHVLEVAAVDGDDEEEKAEITKLIGVRDD